MARDYINFKRVEELSEGDRHVPLYRKIIKLQEEAGEVCQAFLAYDGAENVSASAIDGVEPRINVIEEVCDVINVAMDIINTLDPDGYAVEDMFAKKLSKWAKKQEKNNG